jgi:hypothetical protein
MDKAKAVGRVTPESQQLGAMIASMADKASVQLAAQGEPDERCVSCAFRAGTAPNQCGDTLLDAIKCVVEREPFFCHVKKGWPCHGWFAAAVATKDMPKQIAPFPFSHEEDASHSGQPQPTGQREGER